MASATSSDHDLVGLSPTTLSTSTTSVVIDSFASKVSILRSIQGLVHPAARRHRACGLSPHSLTALLARGQGQAQQQWWKILPPNGTSISVLRRFKYRTADGGQVRPVYDFEIHDTRGRYRVFFFCSLSILGRPAVFRIDSYHTLLFPSSSDLIIFAMGEFDPQKRYQEQEETFVILSLPGRGIMQH